MHKREISHPRWGRIIITFNERARRIIMRARFDAIYVTLPTYTTDGEIEKILEKYGDKLQQLQKSAPQKKIDKGFTIEAPCFTLRLEQQGAAGIMIKGKNGIYTLLYGAETNFDCERTQQILSNAITAAQQHRAKEILPPRLMQLSKQHNLRCKSVTVRNSRTRWGSCSSSGTISLSIHLVLLPQHLIDYVIRHELCHTVEMNHGPRFWALLDELCGASSKELRSELKKFTAQI